MLTLKQTSVEYSTTRKKGIVSYSSKFFAASAIATLATLSYYIVDGTIYGFKFNRHLSMFMLFSVAFVAASLMLAISYGVFKCYNKKGDSLKEAVKITNRKTVSISGKVFAATLAIGVTSLACTLITSAINGQDIPFLSLLRETFGFSKNGAWIGGSGGLLLCFVASSFVVLAIASLMYLCSKNENIGKDNRYNDASKTVHYANINRTDTTKSETEPLIADRRSSDSSISSTLSEAKRVGDEKGKKKL